MRRGTGRVAVVSGTSPAIPLPLARTRRSNLFVQTRGGISDYRRGRIYLGVAEIDHGFPAEQRNRLEQALTEAGVDYTLEVYEGARHGFAVTGHLVYDRDASERHWTRLVALLNDTLQPVSV